MATGSITPSGILFGPNGSGKTYISLNYHRGVPTAFKSTWDTSISRVDEYDIFCDADGANRCDASGVYWGIRNMSFDVLGSRGERLAKFPATVNVQDPWHGYPASPNLKGEADLPSEGVLTVLETYGDMARVWVRRLRTMKI